MIELTDKQQVLDRLAEGHELTNRGTGWWCAGAESCRAARQNQLAPALRSGSLNREPAHHEDQENHQG